MKKTTATRIVIEAVLATLASLLFVPFVLWTRAELASIDEFTTLTMMIPLLGTAVTGLIAMTLWLVTTVELIVGIAQRRHAQTSHTPG